MPSVSRFCLMSPVSRILSHVSCLRNSYYYSSSSSFSSSSYSYFKLKRNFFLAKLPKRNAFLAKRSETKRNFWFVVSRNWSETKRNCFCFAKFRFEAKLFLKRNWDTLGRRDGTEQLSWEDVSGRESCDCTVGTCLVARVGGMELNNFHERM